MLYPERGESPERAPVTLALSRREAIALGFVGALALLMPGCDAARMPTASRGGSRAAGDELPSSPDSPFHPPHPSHCEPSMSLSGIEPGDCKVECHTERTQHKEIAVFDAQVCEFRPGFLVTGPPKCTGRCGDGSSCAANVSYSWAITAQNPAGSASIAGSSTARTVSVRGTRQLGTYTLELTVTLQCQCGGKDEGAPLVQSKSRKFTVNQNCH